jgi:cytochrome c biogenesis protein CcmG/thiol:disulfide interchange protein DsbE
MNRMASNGKLDRRWVVVFLAAAGALIATSWRAVQQPAGVKPVAERQPAPDLTLPLVGGGEWKLADHRGQVVLVNYWATWCGPCQEELPGLKQVEREAGPKGLAVVGISMDSGRARAQAVEEFVSAYRVPWPIAFPDERIEREAIDIGIPTTILIDRQGRAAKTYIGEVGRATLAKDVATLLGES